MDISYFLLPKYKNQELYNKVTMIEENTKFVET